MKKKWHNSYKEMIIEGAVLIVQKTSLKISSRTIELREREQYGTHSTV